MVLVGGVGELYQGDLDLGRRAVERLVNEPLGDHVLVEDLSYGAVAVGQRVEEVRPGMLILVGAARRGRPPGTLERRRARPLAQSPAEARHAVAEAVSGYVSIDLVLEVASALGNLPRRTVVIEAEPASVELGDRLSPELEAKLEQLLDLVRTDVRRAPLLDAADRVRQRLDGPRLERSPAVQAAARLVRELERVDRDGEWGLAFTLRDVLRGRIAAGELGEAMDSLDWALWWALIEELDRLENSERGAI